MGRLFELAVQYLQQDQWPILLVPDQTVAVTRVQGDNGQWECQLYMREEQHLLLFYSICPVMVPENCRATLAEFITRANYGLAVGNFEMDYRDGEVRYKTNMSVSDGMVTGEQVKQVVTPNTLMMDLYLPGIRAVVEDQMQPQAALNLIEGRAA